ncbi:LysR family transcriptional regulator [Pseudarthrobacter sp. AG30]|uniref:LysR family transcriptional regulator n=1 Tax=Pseudarthrobacter sp. AG30 TaxID=2249742 RepID=UPI0014032C7D|nr:LysR family transcriptional regulator [Pseudarthrobacter sp. AG30]
MGTMMELRHLEHFVTVADEANFTRAAERLFITQSGLSSSIKALERELGASLFERTTRRIKLTAEGRRLYEASAQVLKAVEIARQSVSPADSLSQHTLRVGSVPAGAGVELAQWMRKLYRQHPGLSVELTVRARISELLDMVLNDQLDAAFVTMPERAPTGLLCQPLATHPMILACHRDHRLAGEVSVSLQDLADEDFVDFADDSPTRLANNRAFELAGITRHVRLTCDEIQMALELVAAGVGVALAPRPLAQASRAHIVSVPLREESLVWTSALAIKPGARRSPVVSALLQIVSASEGRPNDDLHRQMDDTSAPTAGGLP